MIRLRISTPDNRTTVIVEPEKTVNDIIEENDIHIDGASLNVNGIPLTRDEFQEPISTLASGETATLSVVVKSGNA